MTRFRYRAVNADGRVLRGQMAAHHLADLEIRLRRIGLEFISARPASGRGLRIGLGRGVPRRELLTFCINLEQMIAAGVPILECLCELRDSIAHPPFRQAIAGVIAAIEGGQTLSGAMAEHPDMFDGIFVSLIQAGEASGRLPEVLRNLVDSLKWRDELAAHTRQLLAYPLVVGSVVLAATLFLMIRVVPQLKSFVRGMGQEMPLPTQVLFIVSDGISANWHLALLPIVAVTAGIAWLHASPAAGATIDRLLLRLPLVGEILHKIILARFASTLALLHAAGIPIIESLRTTGNVVGNRHVAKGLHRVGLRIGDGQGITRAFEESGLLPPLVLRMLRVGEGTGALDQALASVSYFYSRDVRESVERKQAMIEPLLTVVLGALLGWIMLAVLGPVYDLVGSIPI